jgi:dUTP pyrophosphatase
MTLSKGKVKVFKIRENSKLPVRAHSSDAGMDLFFCPEDNEPVSLGPSKTCLLQTGLKIEVPRGHMLEIKNKSGIAFKRQLVTGACVVDSGYDGEIFVNLHNIGFQVQVIQPGQKIAQAIFVKVEAPELQLVQDDKIYETETERGSGALGSTGDT